MKRSKFTITDEERKRRSDSMKQFCKDNKGYQYWAQEGYTIEDHPRYGIKHTDYTKYKMSQAKKGRNHPKYKGDIVTPTGIYPTYAEAGKEMGIAPQKVWTRVQSKFERFKDYYFIPVGEES